MEGMPATTSSRLHASRTRAVCARQARLLRLALKACAREFTWLPAITWLPARAMALGVTGCSSTFDAKYSAVAPIRCGWKSLYEL